VVGLTARTLVAALAVALVSGGCGDGGGSAEPRAEVAACDDLRRRENELIAVANEVLADLGAATDDAARTAAIAAGYERLAALAAEQVSTVAPAVEEGLREALVDGASTAATELARQRDRIVARGLVVTRTDERGRAGELQNALEKAFSNLEPPRSVYRSVGLADATDQDPDCRFVTQRADPAS
jgi:hypothetical protein